MGALAAVRSRQENWPNLCFTKAGEQRLFEVFGFLRGLRQAGHELAEEIRAEFYDRMAFLNDFGGTVSDQDDRRRFQITLGRDFAAMSLTITWEALDAKVDDYRFSFRGGLIWHGGSNDPLSVSVTPQWWGIHT